MKLVAMAHHRAAAALPRPFRRKVVPDCVPVGIFSEALPAMVGTWMLPHSAASVRLDRHLHEKGRRS